ncbi:DUF523 domain-containing protein [Vitreoscilla massiliensis]|uniref:DUF523 domain-containing protein n=1 Tax=Vitreoscilla massiliensis TaxID=1689272 RepID=A0ABY4E5B6_9NEIS|nr:DUF523 domain-containing protein [Vitreoscilla massiliensis]UOO90499.1 DUF523 domain-containing protein [Vitreoscilla massiliensis]
MKTLKIHCETAADMEAVAVSACLCGHKVRYDGGDCWDAALAADLAMHTMPTTVLPLCPETLGGLATPRAPAEIVGGDGAAVWEGTAQVLDAHGQEVTKAFKQGALLALQRLQAAGITTVYLKSKSPSCGNGQIYDGSFSGRLCVGDGVSTALFKQHGIIVIAR